jgi:protein-S-isoprenylcysteine O-methyltransferase Ste14
MLKLVSGLGLLMMAGAFLGLLATHALLSSNPLVVAAQAGGCALMVWSRITFGRRSFHATADPTDGGLVTSGPYRFIRHPIYTAACIIGWAGALAHPSTLSACLAVLLFAGGLGRMLAEESLLRQRYPEYADYAARTKRMVPYVF